jgi:AraC-like DNA-binding protein
MLTNPLYRNRSISAIAYDAGFGDVSYFNRTFRRSFSATPSEVRESAQRPK